MCSGSARRYRHAENSVKSNRTVERSAESTHVVSAGWRDGWPSVIRDRAASGEVRLDRALSSLTRGWSLGPFGVCDYDGPETIRFRKYATGTHVLLEEIEVETGVTPRELVWTKNRARLYRYLLADERAVRRRPVPVLLSYGFVLKPYILDLVPGN